MSLPDDQEQTSNPEVQETVVLSEFDRIIGALFDPKEAFADIAVRPVRWWVPLLILTILAMIFLFAFTQQVGWETFFQQQMEIDSRLQELPADQQARILESQVRIVPYFAWGFGLISWPMVALVIAVAMLFLFNVLAGQQLAFRSIFAATCYAVLPVVFFYLTALVTMFIKDPVDFDLQNPIASNLAVFLNPAMDAAWLVSLAKSLDLFNFWVLILLASGMSAIGRRLTWGRAFGWILGGWIMLVTVKVGFSWIFA